MAEVKLRDLSVRFSDFIAVDGIDLDIADGEMVVFLGPSGCGKTTTLRCIAGLQAPTGGQILFNGERVNELHPIERNIAMVFQFIALYPHLRVRDNICFPLKARGMPRQDIARKLEWISELFRLEDILNRFPASLPPGARQKVALARAVVREPNVLLLDEPLSAIDEQFREEMRWELGHLQKQLGFTTVYVTHDQREAMSLADRIVLMRDGKIVQVGTPRQMYEDPANDFAGFFIGSPGMYFIDISVKNERLLLGAEGTQLTVGPRLLQTLTGLGDRPLKLGIRPQHITLTTLTAGHNGSGVLTAPIVDRYSIGREHYFDFQLDDKVYQGQIQGQIQGQGSTHTSGHNPDEAICFDLRQLRFFDRDTGECLELRSEED